MVVPGPEPEPEAGVVTAALSELLPALAQALAPSRGAVVVAITHAAKVETRGHGSLRWAGAGEPLDLGALDIPIESDRVDRDPVV
ncbi:hypothetical protein ENSA5_32460 [Enhygromyxa salina]|uniref:Uncharacterized protein n=1 Tax=Enhygromyxa salina TaxID=215803 RepID=A0A2S9XXH8_9BACT|nr:hypothetical protein [Enhygromyxa salina]PRP97553.1 hypothetical protein ENSA5_32460 [Enhygromyxa salina]